MTALHYGDVWRGIAEREPGRTAVVTRDATWNYGRLAAEADAIARFLADRDLQPLDAAALLLYNLPEYLSINWGCLATGVAPVAINYRYRAREVRDLLIDSDSRVLFAPTSLGQLAAEAAAGLGIELVTIDDGGSPVPGATRYEDLVAAGGQLPPIAPRGADMRIYTGGTTGSPKAVVWELDTLLEARRQSTWGIIGVTPPDSVAAAVDIATDPATTRVTTLPLSPMLHGTASSTTMGTLAIGGTVVLHASPRMDIDEAYRLAMEHRATRLIVAGDALALPLVERAERGEGLPYVTSILSSGMRFSDDVKRRLHTVGDLSIVDMLASSEGGPYAFGITRSVDDLPARLVLQPGAVLLDDEYREITLEPGALGRLAYRGILPKGYYGDPEKTASAFPTIRGHRYVIPGDWARSNGDGTIELLGRLSAVVNTGGEKVFPAEVENALLEHPAVDDAVVFGLPDRRFGEVVCAMVAPAGGAEIDVEALQAFVGERLAGYKKPRHILVRPTLERTLTGKVELARVKEDALRELAQPAEAAR